MAAPPDKPHVRVQPTVQDSWRPRRDALAKAGGDRFGDGAHDVAAPRRETDRPNELRSALYVCIIFGGVQVEGRVHIQRLQMLD